MAAFSFECPIYSHPEPGMLYNTRQHYLRDRQSLVVCLSEMEPGDIIWQSMGWDARLDKVMHLIRCNHQNRTYTFWYVRKNQWAHWIVEPQSAFRLPFSDDLWIRDGRIYKRGPDLSGQPGLKGPTIFDDDL